MADISKIRIGSTDYDIKDTVARKAMVNGIHFIGVTTTVLTDQATTNPITINGEEVTAVNGDLVIHNPTSGVPAEFIWHEEKNGGHWDLFGNTGALGTLAYKNSASVTLSDYVTGATATFSGTSSTITVKGTTSGTVGVTVTPSKADYYQITGVGTLPSLTSNGSVNFGGITYISQTLSGGGVTYTSQTLSGGGVDYTAPTLTSGGITYTSQTLSGGKVTYTAPTLTGLSTTAHNATVSGEILVFNLGTASATFNAGSVTYTSPTLTAGNVAYTSQTLSGGSVSYTSPTLTAGGATYTKPTLTAGGAVLDGTQAYTAPTLSQGTLPTRASVSIVTGISSATGTFTGKEISSTGSYTPAGNVNVTVTKGNKTVTVS